MTGKPSLPGRERGIWFRPIFAFFIVDVNPKRVVDFAVTRAPTEAWTAQRLREATPFRSGPQVLLRDGDPKCGTAFDRVADGAGIEVIRIAPCTPRMHAVVDRFLGAVRRERLDHVIILGEPHLRSVLGQYVETYFNTMRPQPGIGQRIPVSTPRQTCNDASRVGAIPVLGGLHHGYRADA